MKKVTSIVISLVAICLSVSISATSIAEESSEQALKSLLTSLHKASFKEKADYVSQIGELEHERVIPVLSALMEGDLYYIKANKQTVVIKKVDREYATTDAITVEDAGTYSKRKLKKISSNNKLRKHIRGTIAGLRISAKDYDTRLSAIQELIVSPDAALYDKLVKQYIIERDETIKDEIQTAKAMIEISGDDQELKLHAIKVLGNNVYSQSNAKLREVLAKDDDGNYLEKSEAVRAAAQKSLKKIEQSVSFYEFIKNIFFGLSLGSVLLLSAVGLAITFGVMGIINMAHGEMMMLGAYTTFVIQSYFPNLLEYSLLISLPAAFIVTALVGIAIERGIIRYLYGRPLETLLATFGISLVLQQLVRSIFGPLNQAVQSPEWMSGVWEINPAFELTFNRLYIIIFAMVVFALLILVLKKTKFGLQMRAVTQNREMARAVGVRSNWVDAMTFGLGSGIAGIAGVALSQLTNVGPNLGQAYIIDSFMVVVFGGVGNLFGTFFGAMTLGLANKFIEPFAGAVLAKIVILVFIIIFIQRRPRGMFALKGRSVEG